MLLLCDMNRTSIPYLSHTLLKLQDNKIYGIFDYSDLTVEFYTGEFIRTQIVDKLEIENYDDTDRTFALWLPLSVQGCRLGSSGGLSMWSSHSRGVMTSVVRLDDTVLYTFHVTHDSLVMRYLDRVILHILIDSPDTFMTRHLMVTLVMKLSDSYLLRVSHVSNNKLLDIFMTIDGKGGLKYVYVSNYDMDCKGMFLDCPAEFKMPDDLVGRINMLYFS